MTTTTLSVTIPDEPPEWTVVNVGGRAWMRDDSISGRSWWHPAGPYLDDHDRATIAPLRWGPLVARFGKVTVLRWGNGKGAEPAGQQHPDLATRDAEIQRLTDLVDELRQQLTGALTLAHRHGAPIQDWGIPNDPTPAGGEAAALDQIRRHVEHQAPGETA